MSAIVRYLSLSLGVLLATGCGQIFQGEQPGAKDGSISKSSSKALPDVMLSAPLEALDGSTLTLRDKKGKVLLLSFWATWCIPCIEEMPDLVKLQSTHGAEGFEVLGLNIEKPDYMEDFKTLESSVKKIIADQKLNYEVFWVQEPMYDRAFTEAQSEGIPLNFIVDRNQRIRGIYRGSSPETLSQMKQAIKKIIAE